MNPTIPPFDQCPRCDYSLHGLPAEHACPECGLRYDRECELYKALKPVPVVQALVGFFAFFSWVRVIPDIARWPLYVQMLAGVGLVLCIVAVVRAVGGVRAMNRRGRFIAVTGEGLFIRMQSMEPEFIPWSNITRASSTIRSRTATIFIKDKKVVRHIGGVFAKQEDTDRFVEQIEARVPVLRTENPSSDGKSVEDYR